MTKQRLLGRDAQDQGNISVLTLGFVVLAMLVFLVIAAATAVHVQRMRLVHVADELALDAADALDVASYYAGEAPLPTDDAAIQLAQSRMEAAVAAHVASRAGDDLQGMTVTRVWTPDGSTAVVTVSLVVYPLFRLDALAPFADGIELRATGTARTF